MSPTEVFIGRRIDPVLFKKINHGRQISGTGKTLSRCVPEAAQSEDHHTLEQALNRLPEIADALDAAGERAVSLVTEVNTIVQHAVVEHEREDEAAIYPKLSAQLPYPSALAAMSRAHHEIQLLWQGFCCACLPGVAPRMPIAI